MVHCLFPIEQYQYRRNSSGANLPNINLRKHKMSYCDTLTKLTDLKDYFYYSFLQYVSFLKIAYFTKKIRKCLKNNRNKNKKSKEFPFRVQMIGGPLPHWH